MDRREFMKAAAAAAVAGPVLAQSQAQEVVTRVLPPKNYLAITPEWVSDDNKYQWWRTPPVNSLLTQERGDEPAEAIIIAPAEYLLPDLERVRGGYGSRFHRVLSRHFHEFHNEHPVHVPSRSLAYGMLPLCEITVEIQQGSPMFEDLKIAGDVEILVHEVYLPRLRDNILKFEFTQWGSKRRPVFFSQYHMSEHVAKLVKEYMRMLTKLRLHDYKLISDTSLYEDMRFYEDRNC